MTRRVPVVSTIIVVAAAIVMVGLGVWQLQRAQWKNDLLAQYAAADQLDPVPYPRGADFEDVLYRRSSFTCERVLSVNAIAGRNAGGASGMAHVARCQLDGGGEGEVRLGWNRDPAPFDWPGGIVAGILTPAGDHAALVASEPPPGLEPLAKPDPQDLPNNHLAYAGQWFFFALVALLIYALALRKRWREG